MSVPAELGDWMYAPQPAPGQTPSATLWLRVALACGSSPISVHADHGMFVAESPWTSGERYASAQAAPATSSTLWRFSRKPSE